MGGNRCWFRPYLALFYADHFHSSKRHNRGIFRPSVETYSQLAGGRNDRDVVGMAHIDERLGRFENERRRIVGGIGSAASVVFAERNGGRGCQILCSNWSRGYV